MPAKHHRPTVGQLRPHSRTSSATRLAANLQFTQAAPTKQRKSSSNLNGYDHQHNHRSSQRVNSAIHLDPPQKRPPTPKHHPKPKAGFTIAASPDDDNEDDWVSTESGAGTPSHDDALSDDDDSNVATPVERSMPEQLQNKFKAKDYAREERQTKPSAREAQSAQPARTETWAEAPPPPRIQPTMPSRPEPPKAPSPPSPKKIPGSPEPSHIRPGSKRSTRPPSTHSMTGKPDSHLRPHPLIRGNSYGQPNPSFKPTPLAPLAILTDQPNGANEKSSYLDTITQSSPESPLSAPNPRLGRKTSFSSATSVATLPVQPLAKDNSHLRTRTLSAISASSSSNALSSLAHLPTVSRPPSPQTVSFFPVSNPRAHVEAIHPLLHPDYLQGHLTALRYRQPLKECYERVMWAKQRQ